MPETTRDGRSWSSSKVRVWKTDLVGVGIVWGSQSDDAHRVGCSACPLLGKLLCSRDRPARMRAGVEHPTEPGALIYPVTGVG